MYKNNVILLFKVRTKSISPLASKTKNGGSKCDVCNTKKSRFVKKQEAKGLLSNLGIRTPLSKIQYCEISCCIK